MKFYSIFFMILQTSTVYAGLQYTPLVVTCTATGTFHQYEKSFLFSKRIGQSVRELCPGALPSLRSPRNGLLVETTCGSEGIDAGYALTVKSQTQAAGTEVSVFVFESHFNAEGAKPLPIDRILLSEQAPVYSKDYVTDIVTARSSKHEFEKLDSVSIHCESNAEQSHLRISSI